MPREKDRKAVTCHQVRERIKRTCLSSLNVTDFTTPDSETEEARLTERSRTCSFCLLTLSKVSYYGYNFICLDNVWVKSIHMYIAR